MTPTAVGLVVAMIVGAGAGGAYVYERDPTDLVSARDGNSSEPSYPEGSGFVAGVVTTSDGTPLPRVTLVIKGRRDSQAGLRNLSDGTFKLALPSGRHTVTFSHPGYREASVDVRIEEGQTRRVEIVMVPRE